MRLANVCVVAFVATCTIMAEIQLSFAQTSDASPKLKPGFDINALDRDVDPCVDFYHYACGTWLKGNPVPPDRAIYGRSSELIERNRTILRDILEKSSGRARIAAPTNRRSATTMLRAWMKTRSRRKALHP